MPVMPASAQSTTSGAVEGDVRNTANEPLAGIVIQFINQETGAASPATTDSNGHYVRYQLQPGAYLVRVNSQLGYKLYPDPDPQVQRAKNQKVTQKIFITETRQALPTIMLEPEMIAVAPSPTPEVVATPSGTPGPTPVATPLATPLPSPTVGDGGDDPEGIRSDINTRDTRRSGSYQDEEVRTLPLGAITLVRTFDELALFLPGVAPPPQTQGDVAGPGVGAGVG
ncbi:MAG TPA: carboxypeptidase-like regulatory domain-containing protein, partial [Pyrinomonadaceae bacterium]